MTSLTKQLEKLQEAGNSARQQHVKRKATLLFDSDEAADIPLDAIFSLGVGGLDELCTLNSTFVTFKDSLFSEAYLSGSRLSQSKKFNKEISDLVAKFLFLSSPYFLLKPTLKALEWLVRKYEIHKFEMEAVLAAFLPYHETRLFGRLLQILDIRRLGNDWQWLDTSAKNGYSISKLSLSRRCRTDMAFLSFVFGLPRTASIALGDLTQDETAVVAVRRAIDMIHTFSVSCVIIVLGDRQPLSDEMLEFLLPNTLEDLGFNTDKVVVGAYTILCQLLQKVTLSERMKEACSDAICKSLRERTWNCGIMCLATLMKFQRITALNDNCYELLLKHQNLGDLFKTIGEDCDISGLISALLCYLVECTLAISMVESEHEPEYYQTFLSLMDISDLPVDVPLAIARKMVEVFAKMRIVGTAITSLFKDRLTTIAALIERRYPSILDNILKLSREGSVLKLSSKETKEVLQEFKSAIFIQKTPEESGNSAASLYLSLNHASPEVRSIASKVLVEQCKNGTHSKDFSTDQLLARLKDDDLSVVLQVLEDGKDLVNFVEPKLLMQALLNLVYQNKAGVQEHVFKALQGFVIHGITLPKDLDFILLLELVSRSFLCQDPISPCHLENLFGSMGQDLLANRGAVWDELKNASVEIGWEAFKKNDSHAANGAINALLVNISKGLAKEPTVVEMVSSALNHVTKSPVSHPSTWFLYLLLSKLNQQQPISTTTGLLDLCIKHIERRKGQTCKRKYIKMFLRSSSLEELEEKLLSLLRSRKTNQQTMLDVRCSLLLLKSVCAHTPTDDKQCDNGSADVIRSKEQLFRSLCALGSPTSRGKNAPALVYRALLKDFLAAQFGDRNSLLLFLFGMLEKEDNLGWLFAREVPMELTESSLFALHVLSSLISSLPGSHQLLIQHVCSVLLFTSHPLQAVREAALSCLAATLGVCQGKGGNLTVMENFLKTLLLHKEEICSEKSGMNSVLVKYFRSLSSEGQEARVSNSKKVERRQRVLELLLDHRVNHIKYGIHLLLRAVVCKETLSSILEEAQHILSECKTRDFSDMDNAYIAYTLERIPDTYEILPKSDLRSLQLLTQLFAMEGPKRVILRSLQGNAIDKINATLFTHLQGVDDKITLLQATMDFILRSKNIELCSRLKRNLSQMPLTTDHFDVLLQNAFEKLTDAGPKAAKRARRSLAPSAGRRKERLDSTWQRILLVLEEIHHRSYFQGAEVLVPFYFKVLKCCSDDSTTIPSVEYVKQLTMGCLLNVTTALADGTAKGTIAPKDFSVELIISCIRNSKDHHTHQQAHLVLAKAAVLFPDLVLHNMMAIFTFMGSSMLRQDDSYSFDVLKETVSSVIPVLIGTETSNLPARARERQVQEISKLVVGVFADAAPYIPNHRRLMLFSHLTEVLGAANNLHVVLALLLTRAVAKSKQHTASELPKEELLSEEFCVNLTLQFPPKVVMAAIGKLMKMVALLVTRENTAGDEKVASDEQEEDFMVSDLRSQSVKEIRYFVYLVVSITSKLIANTGFRTRIQSWQADEPEEIEKAYLSLLKELLVFVKEEGRLIDDKEPENVVKFRKAIIHKGCSIIDKIDDGLKFETFVRVFKTLITNDSSTVQTKAIELVTEKVLKIRELTESQREELLPLVDILINVIGASQWQSTDHMHTKKTALVALKAFSSRFGPGYAQKFLDGLPAILECCGEAGRFSHFNAHALLCMADFCVAFSVQIIGQLQDIVPYIIKNMTVSSSARENFVPHSAFAGAVKIVEAIPQFISPYTSKLVDYSALIAMDTVSVPPPIQEKARELRLGLGAKIAPRILLPALDNCLDTVKEHHKTYVSYLMEILAEALSKMSNADVQTHIKSFHSIFIKSLQLRAQRLDLPPEEVVQLEQRVVDVYCVHVMKLSENSFRPLFWKVFAWATESDATYDHVTSFFHLCCGLAEKLKSLFLLFAKQVMKTAKETLEKFHVRKLGDLPIRQHPHADSISSQLIELILMCLNKCFVYDRMGFTSKEDFDFLVDALVDQIDNDFGSPELYQKRIEHSLAPCVRSFTTVVHDESCWKVLNSRILLKTKDKRPKVRIASLQILAAVQSALKESYASLLPETIPCLAELMEDENPDVEKKCQDVIGQIEASLGESLQKYF